MTSEPGNRRYLLRAIIALLILALVIAVVLANRYRDTIAREVANRVLADSDITVVDVSVASIRADNVRFEALLLELANGTQLRVEGITLPVRFRSFASTTLGIETVVVTPGAGPSDPFRLADSLRAFLDAPAAMPGGAIAIGELTIPGLPPIRNLGWYTDKLNPTLRANVGEFELFLTLTPAADDDYRAAFRALTPDDNEAIFFAFRIAPAEAGFHVAGNLELQLEPLLPVLHAIDVVPVDVTRFDATIVGDLELTLGNELPVTVTADIDSTPGLNLDFRASKGRFLHVTVNESTPLSAVFEYPTLQWQATLSSAVLTVDTGDVELPPLRLDNATCRSGIHCRVDLGATLRNVNIGTVSLDRITFSANDFEFISDHGEWRGSSGDMTANLRNLAIAGHRLVAPGVKAAVSVTAQGLSIGLDATTPEGGLAGHVDIEHDLARNSGVLRTVNTSLDFAILNLSEALPDWDQDFDITSGYWRIESEVNWAIGDTGFAYTGSSTHSFDDLAGRYGNTGFVGLDTEFDVAVDWQAEPSVSAATLEIALVDIGFPITNLHARITSDLDTLSADVDAVSMSLLGGDVRIDPFRYELGRESNKLIMHTRNIQLPLMVGLADLEAVEISGSVSGDIPVTLRKGTVIVEGGHLENDAPGGTIRYKAGVGIVDEASQLGIVTRTLQNFEFDVLTSDVDYNEQGDLKLQMRMTGTNPDVDPLQPVVLNLGIENNVPQMLRSLQATRSIEEVLARKLGQ